MININLTLRNPWSDQFEPLRSYSKLLTKHSALELEVYRSDTVAEVEVKLTHREDHAGLTLGVGLFSWTIRLQFYDTRHWNYALGKWENSDN